jgi:protein-S-isoprenylcysteine O-methyltransferase Ste14
VITSTLTRTRAIEPPTLRAAAIVAAYVVVFFGLLPALLWTLGGRWDAQLHLPALPAPPIVSVLGAAVAAVGTLGMARAMDALWRVGRGLPISHLPPQHLVTSGPYHWFRHPIYVSDLR